MGNANDLFVHSSPTPFAVEICVGVASRHEICQPTQGWNSSITPHSSHGYAVGGMGV